MKTQKTENRIEKNTAIEKSNSIVSCVKKFEDKFFERYRKNISAKSQFKKAENEFKNKINSVYLYIRRKFSIRSLSKKRNLQKACAALSILVIIIGTFFQSSNTQGATFTWNQTTWSSLSSDNATHPGNETGWNKYTAKDSNIDLSDTGQVALGTTSASVVQTNDGTTETGFNLSGNSNSSSAIYGSGTNASVTIQKRPDVTPMVSSIGNGWGGASCALAADGFVYCWGYNGSGGLGNGTTNNSSIPVRVIRGQAMAGDNTNISGTDYLSNIKHISNAGTQSCAVSNQGYVYCWGRNRAGSLGDGTTSSRSTPVLVLKGSDTAASDTDGTYLAHMSQVGASNNNSEYNFACAIAESGNVYCWGSDYLYQLGDAAVVRNSTTNTSTPVRVRKGNTTDAQDASGDYITNIKKIYASDANVCVVSNSNNLYCWGYGGFGGMGAGGSSSTANKMSKGAAQSGDYSGNYLINIKDAAINGRFGCAVSNNNNVYCWGTNSSGQLGVNDTNARADTVQVLKGDAVAADQDGTSTYLSNIKNIATGNAFACALSNGGNVYCWGSNGYGNIGMGDTSGSHYTPTRVVKGEAPSGDQDATNTYLANILGISSSLDGNTCAVSNSSSVYCWGRGNDHQLGNNSGADSSSPVLAHTLANTHSLSLAHATDTYYFSGTYTSGVIDFGRQSIPTT